MVDSFKAHNEPVMGVSMHSNHANSLFTCSQDGFVRLWDLRKLNQHIWETVGHEKKNDEAVHFIQTNFDGVTISGGADSLLKLYGPIK
jgi:WD40 repeat protein